MTTFVTEDGETGQIYISGGVLPAEVNSGGGGGCQAGLEDEPHIAAIASHDGQVLSLDEGTLEHLAGEVFL